MHVTNCKDFLLKTKVLQKFAKNKQQRIDNRKGYTDMRIEDELVASFNEMEKIEMKDTLSQELDFFFENVMDTVVSYFKEEVAV